MPVENYQPPPTKKYFLAAGAIFKNEAHIIKEWLDHHRREGFEHIYLVNDDSTDNYLEIIQPYIDEGYVTLYQLPDQTERDKITSQYNITDVVDLVNGKILSKQYYALKYILYPIARIEADWFIANDLDEFITTRDNYTVRYNLKQYFQNAHIIRLNNIIYGSNDLIDVPDSAVKAYTKRINLDNSQQFRNDVKTICRPESINMIDIHRPSNDRYQYIGSSLLNPYKIYASERDINNYKIVMNHYKTQSYNYWKNIKMTRGDAHNLDNVRSLKIFNDNNQIANSVIDCYLRDKTYVKPRIDIVVSRYNETLDWLNCKEIKTIFNQKALDYDINLYIYNCGKSIETPIIPNTNVSLIPIENKGMGIYKFLYHIINNYHNLAQMTMLIPGTGWHESKRGYTLKLLGGDWNARTIYTNKIPAPNQYSFTLDEYTNLGLRGEVKNTIKLKPSPIRPFGKWFKHMFGKDYPSTTLVKTNFVDIIGFSKDAVLSVKLETYQQLKDSLDDVHTEVAHYIERSWTLII